MRDESSWVERGDPRRKKASVALLYIKTSGILEDDVKERRHEESIYSEWLAGAVATSSERTNFTALNAL